VGLAGFSGVLNASRRTKSVQKAHWRALSFIASSHIQHEKRVSLPSCRSTPYSKYIIDFPRCYNFYDPVTVLSNAHTGSFFDRVNLMDTQTCFVITGLVPVIHGSLHMDHKNKSCDDGRQKRSKVQTQSSSQMPALTFNSKYFQQLIKNCKNKILTSPILAHIRWVLSDIGQVSAF